MQTDSFYLTFMQIVASWYSFSYKVFSVLFAHVRWKPRIMAGSLAPAIFTVFHWSIQHARPVQADCSKFPSISLFRLSKEQFWGSDWNFKALTPASQYSTTCSAAESAAFCQVFFVFWKFEQSRVSFLGPRWDIATTQNWWHSSYRRRALIFSWPCADAFFWGNGWMMTYAVNPLYIIRSGSETIYESCKLKVPRFWQVQLWPGRRGCDEIISETSSCRFWCGSSSFHILYDVFGWFHPGLKNIFRIFWITVHPVDCCHCLFDKWS